MLKILLQWLLLATIMLLSGCAQLSPNATPVGHAMSWQARSAALAHIRSWDVHGSVSIQHAQKTNMASLQWHQQNSHYQFTLLGPLGFGRVQINGAPGSISLKQSGKPPISANTPESLMQNQLGWHIPISHLYYWARGLPAPGLPAKKSFDRYHHLNQLQQENWQITYGAYMTVNQIDLPRTIQLDNKNLRIKLAIRHWEVGLKD